MSVCSTKRRTGDADRATESYPKAYAMIAEKSKL